MHTYYDDLKNNMLFIYLGDGIGIDNLIAETPPKMLAYLENKLNSEENIYVDWFLLERDCYSDDEDIESNFKIYYDFNPRCFLKIPSKTVFDMVCSYDESTQPRTYPNFAEIKNLNATEIIV
jgi:hypothetical protein